MRLRSAGLTALALLLATSVSAIDQASETRAITEWRAKRVAHLTSESGWLTLVGLYWLQDGDNTFGKEASNTLRLDRASVPPNIGIFIRTGKAVTFVAQTNVTENGKAIKQIGMKPDSEATPTLLTVGTIQFFVIERGGKLGVRVRDTAHPARKNFKGLDYFPVDASWVVDARFEPYQPARQIQIVNVLGMIEPATSPGAVIFERDGKRFRLDTVLELPDDKELFVMFADATNARETYGAGRFMYIPMPVNHRAVIDFNKAYNPPCAFNDFATCPLPPPQNRLSLRIDAGEKKYAAH